MVLHLLLPWYFIYFNGLTFKFWPLYIEHLLKELKSVFEIKPTTYKGELALFKMTAAENKSKKVRRSWVIWQRQSEYLAGAGGATESHV